MEQKQGHMLPGAKPIGRAHETGPYQQVPYDFLGKIAGTV